MVPLHVMDELYRLMAVDGVALNQDEPSAEQVPHSIMHVIEELGHIVHDGWQFGHHSSLRNKLPGSRNCFPDEFI